MKKYLIFLLFIFSIFLPGNLKSQAFIGLGADFVVPVGSFADANSESTGIRIRIESRRYCQLWFGVQLESVSFPKRIDSNHIENMILFSPEVKYIFNPSNCRDKKTSFYAQALLTISSIGGNDRKSRMGFGGGLGLGANMPFVMFRKCWGVDFSAVYTVPNFIARADGRSALQSINVSATLFVGF